MENNADMIAARELFLYAENDEMLYRRFFAPIYNNLQRKYNKGAYKHELAPKAFIAAVRESAKKYAQDFADQKEWPVIFSMASRHAACQMFADRFLDDAEFNKTNGCWA